MEARAKDDEIKNAVFESSAIELSSFSDISVKRDSIDGELAKTQETGYDFVTLQEVEKSFEQKEQSDDLSATGSHLSGNISHFSDHLKRGQFNSSFSALKEKKNQLIDSLKSVLANSSGGIETSSIEDQVNTSIASMMSDSENSEFTPNLVTSTPFPETKPLAARFLKKWKPSFINEEMCELDEIDTSDDPYEKAMAGLKEILSDTSADTDSKLNSYSNMLDVFKLESDKKYYKMMSTITSENVELTECLENPTKEVDEFIEKFSERQIGPGSLSTVNETVIEICSKDSTLVAPEEIFTISDSDTTVKDDPINLGVVTINSSRSENEETLTQDKKSEISQTSVEPLKCDVIKQTVPNNVPKEHDHEILIIEGDEDIDINIDDEDLLLASDDEGNNKHDISEKKIHPQIPLVKDLEVFISTDPDENRDNNDPKWDYLRNMGNDYDRYLAVRSRWKNIQIPNPKKDMTCRCRNSVNPILSYQTFNQNNNITNSMNNNNDITSRKRLHSPESQYKFSKRIRRESCTILFDRNIDQLAQDVKIERQRILNEQEQALQQLADLQHMQKYLTKKKGGTMMDMKRLENTHIIDTRNCVEDFRRKLEELINMARAKLTALQKASEEVRQFHEFYPNEDEKHGDTKSLVYLSDIEVQEILEVEEMLQSYPKFYNE